MVQQLHRKKSKRTSCRKRYKIEKKVKEHRRKSKRDAKKKSQKRKKKDPGVPNSLPFKNKILHEAEERKKRAEEMKQRRKADRQALHDRHRNLEDLQQSAEQKDREYENRLAEKEEEMFNTLINPPVVERSMKAYSKEFKKVVEAADVVLQVLDARDPLGSRCPQVENAVLGASSNKRLVLVLNKIDLIPKDNLEKWLKYLRNEFPTVAFKASTQNQRNNLSLKKVPVHLCKELHTSNNCFGASMLMTLLGNYCRNKDIRTAIRVGVVGFPNVGKSSIINSLKRSKACNVGAVPGVTKTMQEVYLHKYIKLLDSPGVVMARNSNDAAAALRNIIKIQDVTDPITPIEAILRRCSKDQLMQHFNIGEFADVNEFLCLLAKRKGFLKKGGVPDSRKAARTVINDWNRGKIHYYTHSPEQHTLPTHVSAEIVSSMSKEFDIEALIAQEQKLLKDLRNPSLKKPMLISPSCPTNAFDSDLSEQANTKSGSDSEEDMEEEETKSQISDVLSDQVTVDMGNKGNKEKSKLQKKTVRFNEGNLQMNKIVKEEFKRQKKMAKRAAKVADSLAESLITSVTLSDSASEDYDFNIL